MKIYVYDCGWSGADIFVSDKGIETALQYFRDSNLPEYKLRSTMHDLHSQANGPNPWNIYVELYSGDFSDRLKIYDVEEGLTFSTEGE